MKNKESDSVVVSCRVPRAVHAEMTSILNDLRTNNNHFVAAAISEYVTLVTNAEWAPSKGLRMDRACWEISQEPDGEEAA